MPRSTLRGRGDASQLFEGLGHGMERQLRLARERESQQDLADDDETQEDVALQNVMAAVANVAGWGGMVNEEDRDDDQVTEAGEEGGGEEATPEMELEALEVEGEASGGEEVQLAEPEMELEALEVEGVTAREEDDREQAFAEEVAAENDVSIFHPSHEEEAPRIRSAADAARVLNQRPQPRRRRVLRDNIQCAQPHACSPSGQN